ncbi:MAG: hypothetical protein A2167_02255 [Planctomycetes bacterium RBG_13_46_10]|nr:MAG: hypothetical protein A2167_02255 [Planctomycetes bacterium RBG_13_46_10]
MINFRCPKCSVKLAAQEDRVGRISKCPRCKSEITIPASSLPESSEARGKVEISTGDSSKLLDESMFQLPLKQNRSDDESELSRREKEQLESLGFITGPKYTGERKFPWPIDILLYPCSASGLTNLAIIIGIPLMQNFIGRFAGFLSVILAIPFFCLNILIGLYAGWYLAECVQDSAKGGTRAPEVLAVETGLAEMKSRVLYLVAVYILFVLPSFLYRLYTVRMDIIFWVLVSWAVIFFPMGLLAMVMFDSTDALNPIFLLGSIFRVFFQYIGLSILFGTLVGLIWFIPIGSEYQTAPILLEIIKTIISGYGVFIMAHVLGRFYWRYKDKLDWGI